MISHPNKYSYDKWPQKLITIHDPRKRIGRPKQRLFFFGTLHFFCPKKNPFPYVKSLLPTGVSTFWRFEVHSGATTCCGSGRETSVEKQRACEASNKTWQGVGRMGGCLVVEYVKLIKRKTTKTRGKRNTRTKDMDITWLISLYNSIAFLLLVCLMMEWTQFHVRFHHPEENQFFNKQIIMEDRQRCHHCYGQYKSAIEMEFVHPSEHFATILPS